MKYFDKYGFGKEIDIHTVKDLVEQAVNVELEYNISSHTGEYYSFDLPGIGFDIFKLCFNNICDEDGCFFQYKQFSEHAIILLTWGNNLETINWYQDKLVELANAKFLSRKEVD
jgi:hypothetical protein